MSLPSIRIWPPVGRSKPAIKRRVLVLPHPEGPSNEKNSPGPDLEIDDDRPRWSRRRSCGGQLVEQHRQAWRASLLTPPAYGPGEDLQRFQVDVDVWSSVC